ncbi:Adenine permease AdeQ [Candidatus Hepatincola sp. Pdp]
MLEKFFKIQERGTTLSKEIYAGLVIFTITSYIIFVLPAFLSSVGINANVAFMSICLTMAASCILLGLITNLPLIMGPTSTITIIVSYTIMLGMGFTYGNALVISLICAIIVIICSFFVSKEFLNSALPASLKTSISAGIGFFILFIGLKNAGIVIPDNHTFITLGDVHSHTVLLTAISLLILIVAHSYKKNYVTFLVIIALSFYAYLTKETHFSGIINANLSNIPFLEYDFNNLARISIFSAILGLLLAANFDTLATILGYAYLSKTENELSGNIKKLYFTKGITSSIATLLGSPPNGLFLESNMGIPLGAKTGIVPIIVGILFFIMVFFSPLLTLIPLWATSPLLIFIGLLMGSSVKQLPWDNELEYLPALLCIISMPLTHSIVNGIAIGFIAYSLVQLIAGRIKTTPKATIVISILFFLTFI